MRIETNDPDSIIETLNFLYREIDKLHNPSLNEMSRLGYLRATTDCKDIVGKLIGELYNYKAIRR